MLTAGTCGWTQHIALQESQIPMYPSMVIVVPHMTIEHAPLVHVVLSMASAALVAIFVVQAIAILGSAKTRPHLYRQTAPVVPTSITTRARAPPSEIAAQPPDTAAVQLIIVPLGTAILEHVTLTLVVPVLTGAVVLISKATRFVKEVRLVTAALYTDIVEAPQTSAVWVIAIVALVKMGQRRVQTEPAAQV